MQTKETPQRPQKILVVDDHVLFREGLMSLFRTTPEFEVVGGAGGVFEGTEMANLLHPDIILMDFYMPDGTGLDATRSILANLPDCKIVFLTVSETDENLFSALRAGAKGYMLKNIPSTDLVSSLQALSRGEIALSRRMTSRVVNEFVKATFLESDSSLISRLSARERDVLRELESGASNQEIAQKLFLSENTVKHHIRSILEKLGVENRREAAQVARQYGITTSSIKTLNPGLNKG